MADKDFNDLEEELLLKFRDIAKSIMQKNLDNRNKEEEYKNIEGADGIERNYKNTSSRTIKTIFGDIKLDRVGYGAPESESLFPTDLMMNLPKNSFSYSLQKNLCKEIIKGSYDEAIQNISEQTGVTIPKSQALEIIENSAQDFEDFYNIKENTDKIRKKANNLPIQVITIETPVTSIYSADRYIRTPEEIISNIGDITQEKSEPVEKITWTLEKSISNTIKDLFAEAKKRDPKCKKETIALIDDQALQLDCIEKHAKQKGIEITIILNIIHIIEHLWEAADALFGEENIKSDSWVQKKTLRLLQNKSSIVASSIRRTATNRGISGKKRKILDKTADYIKNHATYMKYKDYLEKGYPIASEVTEGPYKHIVRDKEAILKLRSIMKNGDFHDYWKFHLDMERERNHKSKYKNPDKLFKRKTKN